VLEVSKLKYFLQHKRLIAMLMLVVLGITWPSSKFALAADGPWLYLKNEGQQRCLDFGGINPEPILWSCNGGTPQGFLAIPQPDNQVVIVNQAYGKCLDGFKPHVAFKTNCSVFPGEIRGENTELSDTRMWSFKLVRAPFYQIVSKAAGECLQFNQKESEMVLAPCDDSDTNQLWSWNWQ
jgi:hypothetical protein